MISSSVAPASSRPHPHVTQSLRFWSTQLFVALCLSLTVFSGSSRAAAVMENLGRGVVAVRSSSTQTYVGWRMLGTDSPLIAFNVYRSTAGGAPVLLNASPITATTDFVDSSADFTESNAYFVRAVIDGIEQSSSTASTLPANVPVQQYKSVPLQIPPGGSFMGSSYTYNANDSSVADLDGDGEYEIIVKWDPSNSRDTASTGYSGPCIIDAYKLNGTRLWRINLGPNIRSGAHYTQFVVADFDNDGKAELICKTADGTVDGQGVRIGTTDILVSTDSATQGRTLAGPEFLTVFNGQSGAAMQTINYIPGRDPIGGWGGVGGNGNSDSVGNRVDRFNAGIGWLDGVLPSAVMCRGYYGRSVIWAVDWRNGQLTTRWVFDSSLPPYVSHPITYPYSNPTSIPQMPAGTPAVSPANQNRLSTFSGQGAHSLMIADVDGDGKDDVVYHSMTVNSDGTGRYTTGLRHGDASNVADIIPSRPGLEVFTVHETEGANTIAYNTPGMALHDASTGEVLWAANPAVDTGRGRAADIDPNFPGYEAWGGAGGTRRTDTGATIYSQTPSSTNMTVWWDADLLHELEDGTSITKWNFNTRSTNPLLTTTGLAQNNSTKSNPCLIADMLGDWREEVLWRTSNNSEIRIYTTTIPAANRFWTFMHDRQYRASVAWQQSSYNQPADTSFFVGAGMDPQPTANVVTGPVTVTRGGFTLNRRTGRITQQLTLTSISTVPLAGPLAVMLDTLSSNTSLANRTGTTVNAAPAGSPYLVVSPVDLAPGQSLSVSLEFTPPTSGGITYTPRALVGAAAP